jgi:putative peptidoglycan lipid II flippase
MKEIQSAAQMERPDSLALRIGKLGILTLLSSFFGLLRELGIAHWFGATHATDAFLVALAIPSLLYTLLFGCGLNVSAIPRLASLLKDQPAVAAKYFAEFLSAAALIGLMVSLSIAVFAGPLLKVFAPGMAYSPLTLKFVWCLSPVFFLFVIAYCFGSFQCARNHTSYWAAIALSQNLVVVAAMVMLASKSAITTLVVGTILGCLLALLIQLYLFYRAGFKLQWINPLRRGQGLAILYAMIPFALTFGIGGDHGTNQADVFLVRIFASWLAPGSITLLALSNKLVAVPVLLVGSVIGLVLMPDMTIHVNQGRLSEALSKLTQALTMALVIVCPILVLYADTSGPVIQFLFGHGALQTTQIEELSGILRAYSGAVIGWTAVYVLNSLLASMRRIRMLIVSGISAVLVDGILMYFLAGKMGARGIALAVSLTAVFYATVLAVPYVRRLSPVQRADAGKSLAVILLGVILMHLALRVILRLNLVTSLPLLGRGIIPGGVGSLAYSAWLAMNRRRMNLWPV